MMVEIKLIKMRSALTTLVFLLGFMISSNGQTANYHQSTAPEWTEADRKYLLDNLIRSKEALIEETKNLTSEQWNFKESPDRWSINQIVEHICLWELIGTNGISQSLQMGPLPDFQYLPDTLFLDPDPEGLKKNVTTDYTKPFTYGVPLGNNEGKNNIIWMTNMRNESIEYLKSETRNIRTYYVCFGPNVHQRYMMIFQHTFRHLNQIKKIKSDPKYPK
jgi:hypothetical protein